MYNVRKWIIQKLGGVYVEPRKTVPVEHAHRDDLIDELRIRYDARIAYWMKGTAISLEGAAGWVNSGSKDIKGAHIIIVPETVREEK